MINRPGDHAIVGIPGLRGPPSDWPTSAEPGGTTTSSVHEVAVMWRSFQVSNEEHGVWSSGDSAIPGLSVSVLSFGTMTIGGRDRFGKMGNLGVADTVARCSTLCRDAGVTTIDTADVYSLGGAEEILGEALQGRRDDFVARHQGVHAARYRPARRRPVAQAPDPGVRGEPAPAADGLRRSLIGHEPDMCVALEETMRAFDDLVTQGKVRYVGCSNHSAWQVMKALAVSDRLGAAALRLPAGELQPGRARRRARDRSAGHRSVRRADGVEPAPRRPAQRQVPARRAAAHPSAASTSSEVPGTVDFDRVYRIVDTLDGDRAGARRRRPRRLR